jgi:hypothetical protein
MPFSKKLISEVMRELGRKGGKIGGKRSLETMTREERVARAKKASLAAAKKRMAKRKKRSGGGGEVRGGRANQSRGGACRELALGGSGGIGKKF